MRIDPLDFDAMAQPASVLASDPRKTMLAKLYLALVLNGIDPKGSRA
jgi:hypothetical protein